jgi:protoporphyrinogen oxidase
VAAHRDEVVIIGAGPAGLTAAYELTKYARRPIVLEKSDRFGGLACTVNYKGFSFDIGGHRFFTKVPEVQKLWDEVLGSDFLVRPRLSRIYYRRRFFHYPLKPANALRGLGLAESLRIVASYLRWQIRPYRRVDTFEQWVTNRFGRRLFQTFFKTYTEKVWGIPCTELRAEWAAQRIKDLSLRTALVSIIRKPGRRIRSLIEEFHYPRRGPGMLWDAVAARVRERGGDVRLGCEVVGIRWAGRRVVGLVVRRDGAEENVPGHEFISSMPLRELVEKLDPPAPEAVRAAARRLTYRDFITVCVIVDRPQLFPDNWIYVHDPEVQAGRIQNLKNWSAEMVADASRTSLGLEYFCQEGDALWRRSDRELVALARDEVERMGLARAADVEDGCVVRMPNAYPVYDATYADSLAIVREYLAGFENFQTIGRNGLHRYNNQDHAMLTGMTAVRNVVRGARQDVWGINADPAYHEEIDEVAGPAAAAAVESALTRAFPKVDRVALGLALGVVAGLVLCLTTLAVAWAPTVELPLALLAQFFPGYQVSMGGALVGLGYGFGTGFAVGWSCAALRNAVALLFLRALRQRIERSSLGRLTDYL